MNSQALAHDINAFITGGWAATTTAVTAGGAGDATEKDGAYIAVPAGSQSATCLIGFTTTLQATETLSLGGNVQDATALAGTGVADFGDAVASAVVATGETGGSTETGYLAIPVNLANNRGFIRVQFTPDCSASGTDTAELNAVWVFHKPNP